MYGITGTHNDVSSSVLDAAYVVENGKMVMETDLDMNGKRLLNYNPKSKAVIFGNYDSNRRVAVFPKGPFIINDAQYNVFGFDFTIKKITLTIISRTLSSFNPANTRLRLYIAPGKERTASGVRTASEVSYSFDFAVGANESLRVDLLKTGGILQANAAILIEI